MAATKCCPDTALLHGLDFLFFCLFLRLKISMCLSPFCRHFLKTYCELSPMRFSLPPQHRGISQSLGLHLFHSPSLSLFCLISFIFFFFFLMCLFLSPFLSVSLSSVLFPFCFSHSLYLSTPSHPYPHPPQLCLFLQAWSFPGHKFPSLQPYGSHYHSLSRTHWPSLGLSLFTMLLSLSPFLSLSLSSSLQDSSIFGCYVTATRSLCPSHSTLPALSVSPCSYHGVSN